MKCPGCGWRLEESIFTFAGWYIYNCKLCGTQVRVLYGEGVKK